MPNGYPTHKTPGKKEGKKRSLREHEKPFRHPRPEVYSVSNSKRSGNYLETKITTTFFPSGAIKRVVETRNLRQVVETVMVPQKPVIAAKRTKTSLKYKPAKPKPGFIPYNYHVEVELESRGVPIGEVGGYIRSPTISTDLTIIRGLCVLHHPNIVYCERKVPFYCHECDFYNSYFAKLKAKKAKP